MGDVDIRLVKVILRSCSTKLKSFLNNLYTINEDEFCFMLIILGEYLYSKYYEYGNKIGKFKYEVYANVVSEVLKDTGYSELSYDIISLRNMICHSYGSEVMMNKLKGLIKQKDEISDFLKFLLQDNSNQSALDSMVSHATK